MSARLHFVVEGQSEEAFVNQILKPHLTGFQVWADARCVYTSRSGPCRHLDEWIAKLEDLGSQG